MKAKSKNMLLPIETKKFNLNELVWGIKKLNRRIDDVKKLKIDGVCFDDAQVDNVENKTRYTIREIFGENSSEFRNHQHHEIWYGPHHIGSTYEERQQKFMDGIPQTITMLNGLINWLEEKREEISEQVDRQSSVIDFWNDIHSKITSVAKSRFESAHYADAVESAFKEVNSSVKQIYKRKTGNELDGASLMRAALSPNNPIIVLDDLSTESGKNIQQGYMEIFAGSIIGIRNPKAHDNITIDMKRAIHFIYLASLLMYKIDERL